MDFIFLALTNAEDGRDEAFNIWYNTHHVSEVLRFGMGFVKARRYRVQSDAACDNALRWRYLALYQMVSDDLRAYHQAPWRDLSPPLTPFRGLLKDDHIALIYRPLFPQPAAPALVETANTLVFDLVRANSHHEPAFNEWLDRTHIPDVLAGSPMAIAVHRYALADHQRPSQAATPDWNYLTVYEATGDDSNAVDALITAVRGGGPNEDRTDPLWTERAVGAWLAISKCYSAESA